MRRNSRVNDSLNQEVAYMNNISEKKMRETLSQDIQVSNLVNQRLRDTYKIIENGQERSEEGSGRKKGYRKNLRVAAAAAAIICCGVPSMVYASVKTGFFDGMFGNSTKKSTGVIHREIDDGKDGTVAVEIPSKEFVPVDEAKAEALIGQWVTEEPIVKKIGEHTLTIESFAYDKNGAWMYFTLEREGGVTALRGDMDTNLTKGAEFTDDADFYFQVNCGDEISGYENIYIDTEKSTEDRLYCSSYILWSQGLNEGDIPRLEIEAYPCTRGELFAMDDAKYAETLAKARTESIVLSDKGQIPVETIDLGENGYLEYSPVSVSVDMSKGMGLTAEEAQDPYYLKHLEIRYKDGGSYVISDEEECIENNGYVLGTDVWYKAAFNRIVDTGEVVEIIVNDVSFPAE